VNSTAARRYPPDGAGILRFCDPIRRNTNPMRR